MKPIPAFTLMLLRVLLVNMLLILLTMTLVNAQDPGSGGPQPNTPPGQPEPTAVPLDGGAALLLAGGVAYALRHLPRRR